MKNKFLFLLIPSLIIPVLVFNQCSNTKVVPDVCFNKNVLPIFISKCTTSGCHGGTGASSGNKDGNLNLTTYEGIMSKVKPYYPFLSEVYTKCRGNNPEMPPASSAQLTSSELEYIKYWIHTGAKNSSDCGGATCDTVNVSFSGRIKPIIDTWCIGCHNTNSSGGGYDFSTYEGVKSAIAPDDRLTGSVLQLSGYSKMPQTGKLDDCDLKAIQKWVSSGYPNN